MKLKVWTDGGSRGNPGHSSIGVVVKDASNNITLQAFGCYIGNYLTSVVAEYTAAIRALEYIYMMYPEVEFIQMYLDALLVINQIRGYYKVKSPHIRPLYERLKLLSSKFNIVWQHIPREQNQEADRQVNLALDKKLGTL